MSSRKRWKFYLGIILLGLAAIFLAYILTTGPYDKIREQSKYIPYDSPKSLVFDDVEPGDKLILNYESTEPVNVIIMKTSDSGDYFLLEDRSVEHYILATESTGGSFEFVFNRTGRWGVYFENPYPPPPYEKPKVTYWGEFIEKNKDLTMHYTNLITCLILIVLGSILIYSSRKKKKKRK